MTATVNTTSISESRTIESMIKEALTFKHYGYKEINDDAERALIVIRSISSVVSTYNGKVGTDAIRAGDKITVTSVVIGYDRNNNGEYVEYTIPVNRTFIIN